jgi:hypothetical protein
MEFPCAARKYFTVRPLAFGSSLTAKRVYSFTPVEIAHGNGWFGGEREDPAELNNCGPGKT